MDDYDLEPSVRLLRRTLDPQRVRARMSDEIGQIITAAYEAVRQADVSLIVGPPSAGIPREVETEIRRQGWVLGVHLAEGPINVSDSACVHVLSTKSPVPLARVKLAWHEETEGFLGDPVLVVVEALLPHIASTVEP